MISDNFKNKNFKATFGGSCVIFMQDNEFMWRKH